MLAGSCLTATQGFLKGGSAPLCSTIMIKSDTEPDGFPLASPHVTDEAWVGRAGHAPNELRTGKG